MCDMAAHPCARTWAVRHCTELALQECSIWCLVASPARACYGQLPENTQFHLLVLFARYDVPPASIARAKCLKSLTRTVHDVLDGLFLHFPLHIGLVPARLRRSLRRMRAMPWPDCIAPSRTPSTIQLSPRPLELADVIVRRDAPAPNSAPMQEHGARRSGGQGVFIARVDVVGASGRSPVEPFRVGNLHEWRSNASACHRDCHELAISASFDALRAIIHVHSFLRASKAAGV